MAIGSAALATAVQEAVDGFAASVTVETPDPQPPSHRSFVITGIEDETAVGYIGLYLVGLVVQAVSEDLTILGEIVPPDPTAWAHVQNDVEHLVGSCNPVDAEFGTTRRNPWIMEALTRLLAHTSATTNGGFPPEVLAVTRVTPSVTRSGLDLVGIYREAGTLDFLVGEIKTTADNLNGNLSECYSTFRQVVTGGRSLELRAHLQNLALCLTAADRMGIAKIMYSSEPLLVPIASHGPTNAFDPNRNREKLREGLATRPERLRFVICPITGYREFFDAVAQAMRTHVRDMMA